MFKTTFKGLMAHKLRMALTALAVVLGVGFIAGTYVLTDTMNSAFDNLFDDVSQGIDVYVRGSSDFEASFGGSRQPIDDDLLETVQGVDGVDVAAGSVEGYAQFVDKDGEAIAPGGAPTLGFNWTPEPLNPIDLTAGEPPSGPDEVVIDAGTAEEYGFEVGDPIEVITLEEPRRFTVSGIGSFGSAQNLGGSTIAIFDTPTAQELFDKQGKFDSIEVAAEEGVGESELRDGIAEVLPEGVDAETAASVSDEQSQAIQEGLSFFNTALLIFAGIALFVGAFLIFNTFTITVAQRTHEFALLRALGASGSQIMGSVVIEALIVGIVAAVVGIGAGILIAMGLNGLLEVFGIDLPQAGLVLQPRTIVVSMVVGVVVTLVSSILPARRAARIAPMEALRESTPATYRPSGRRILIGSLLTVLGIAALLVGLFADVSQEVTWVGAGAMIIFFGVATLAPVFARPLAVAIGTPMRSLFRMPGRLAQQNAARNPKRTAATAAALMIGLALVGFVSIFGSSSKASINKVLDESMKADFLVQSSSFASQVISPKLAEELREKSELAAVAPFRLGQFRRDGASLFAIGTDPDALTQTADIGVVAGDLDDLESGGVFLYDATAEQLGLEVGDDLEMQFPSTGEQQLEVVGLFDDKTLIGSDYLISLDTYDANFPQKIDTSILIKAAEGVSLDEARAAVESVASKYPNVEVENQAEAKATYAEQIDQLLGLVTALLALALVIAVLGITNTLALSVYERTRELGLLRAVGMTRKQTRSMIRWESVIIVTIGAILGIVIGTFFGWALVQALSDEGITEFAIPGGQLLIYLVVAALFGVIAAIPPARRAARLNVLEAIATE
ncbi:MAG TPA: FtsX-like permease family protein [Actinomycetota bacterium]|nr:FtsX-like permease family protein [Actinomycetota bacterium]